RPERCEQSRRSMKQLIHRRTRDGHPLPRQLLLEAIDRQMVSALRDGEMREEARSVLALLDDLRRTRCRDHAATAAAAKHLLDVLVTHEPRGHELPDEGALARAHRDEIRTPARGTPSKRLRHLVIDPQSWSLGFGLGSSSPRRLLLLRRCWLTRLHAR